MRDERVVATSPGNAAPEYRVRAVLRREVHADSPAVRLVLEGPLAGETEYWDSHHVELAIDLLERALPVLQDAERRLDAEWQAWRERPGPSESSPA